MFWLLFSIAVGFCFLAQLFDDIESERGIKAGVAIEAFTWLIGSKPSFRAYFLRDSLLLAAVTAPESCSSFRTQSRNSCRPRGSCRLWGETHPRRAGVARVSQEVTKKAGYYEF